MTEPQLPPLQFRPVTEGLGLNHLKDGLPYRPVVPPRKPSRGVDVSPHGATSASSEFRDPLQVKAEVVKSEYIYAGSLQRLIAFLFDVSAVALIVLVVLWVSMGINQLTWEELSWGVRAQQLRVLTVMMFFGVGAAYFLIQELIWRATLGKVLMGIQVQAQSNWSIFFRFLFLPVALVPLGLGLLWYFVDHRKRCWHDVVTGSQVVLQ